MELSRSIPPDAPHLPAGQVAAELSGFGPHFGFSTRRSTAVRGAPWRSISEWLDGSGGLEQHYRGIQATLGERSGRIVDLRVAASTGHFGLVSRLLCPAIGAAALGYRLGLSDLWWHPAATGPLALSLPDGAVEPTDTTTLWTGLVAELTLATADFSVSLRVLEGNIASAVNGAAATVVDLRPDLAARTMTIARRLLPDAGPAFRRRSCCLIYRIASAPTRIYCNDCVLGPPTRATAGS